MHALRQLLEWDAAVRAWLTTFHHPAADVVMVGLSAIGRGAAVWIAMALALVVADRSRIRGALVVLAAVGLALAMTDLILKPLFDRPRPFETAAATRVLDRLPTTASFPSGHAASAFAGGMTLARLWPAGRIVAWVLATLIALSRIYVGVHYPLDVVAGALLGIACACAAVNLGRLVHRPGT